MWLQAEISGSNDKTLLIEDGKSIRDNSTRWKSWYAMINCALEEQIKPAIDLYCFQVGEELGADLLSRTDWNNLRDICAFLEDFHEVTKATEGQAATLERLLPSMDYLLKKLEAGKIEYAADSFMIQGTNSSWAKLDKYYGLTERSPVYTTAMVLIPSQKWTYFEDNWPANWVVEAKKHVREFWEGQYRSTEVVLPNIEPQLKTGFAKSRADKTRQVPVADEYVRYFQAVCCPIEVDSETWWMEPTTPRERLHTITL